MNRARLAMKRIQSHVNPRYSPEYTEKGRVMKYATGSPHLLTKNRSKLEGGLSFPRNQS